MTEETKQEEIKQESEVKQEEEQELITKPKRQGRKLDGDEKVKFLERMKTGREKKKTNTIKVESVYKAPPAEVEESADYDVKELLQFVRDYKQRKETKKVEPVKKKVVPDDVYQSRVHELKQNYLSQQVLKDLFG